METISKKREELEMKTIELDFTEKEYNLIRAKSDSKYFEKHQEVDLVGMKEEIKRRGIEACLNVIKMNNGLKYDTTRIAEDKLQKFISELQVV